MKYLTSLIPVFFLVLSQLPAQAPVAYLRSMREVSVTSPSSLLSHDHVPVHAASNMLLVPGKVNGVRGFFLLDTGSPSLVVHSKWVREAGEIIGGQSVDGQTVSLREVKLEEVVYRNRTYQNIDALSLDLSHLDELTDEPVLGLLGKDWIAQQPSVLDFKRNHILYLSESDKIAWRARKPVAVSAITWADHIPVITIYIHGKLFRFGIDSGSSDNLIDPRVLNALNEDQVQVLDCIDLQGLSGSLIRTDRIQIDEVRLTADQEAFPSSFIVADLSSVRHANDSQLDGLIGVSFLKDMILSIDYQSGRVLWWTVK